MSQGGEYIQCVDKGNSDLGQVPREVSNEIYEPQVIQYKICHGLEG